MNNAQTIPPKDKPFAPNAPKHLDYDFLREVGLKHIQDLSGQLWTDHNTHDPGITILEVLCYALTDLAYRTQLPDADLFAPDPKKRTAAGDDNFPTAYTMLSCNPLTELDWRKLLIDIKGVRNAWFVPIETEKTRLTTVVIDGKEVVIGKDSDAHLWKNELWRTESLVFLDANKRELTSLVVKKELASLIAAKGEKESSAIKKEWIFLDTELETEKKELTFFNTENKELTFLDIDKVRTDSLDTKNTII